MMRLKAILVCMDTSVISQLCLLASNDKLVMDLLIIVHEDNYNIVVVK